MNAMRAGRNYTKLFFPRCRSSSVAQCHFQSELSRLREQFPDPSVTTGEVVSVVFWGAVFLQTTGWVFRYGRGTYEEWTANYKMQKMLQELDRKKMESSEAYLEAIHRKMEALKPRLLKRDGLDEWELKKYEREAAVLKSRLYEWTHGMDASAPTPTPTPTRAPAPAC